MRFARPRLRLATLALLLLAAAWQPAARAALNVIVISDLNGSYGSTRYEPGVGLAVSRIIELEPDLVISTGDMVAGQRLHPPLAAPAIEAMWTAFHAAVSTPLAEAGIPLAVTPGNHDASAYPSFRAEREIFRQQWQSRAPKLEFVDRDGYPFSYAFALGGVLFVSLDVTKVGTLDEPQRRWLDGLLETHGQRYRHRVVFSHLPIYPFTLGRESEVSADHELERILQRHGVELYLSGHHHAYYPGYRRGVRFVSQACLGAGPRPLIGTTSRAGRAITVLEFDEQGPAAIGALGGPRFRDPVEIRQLPESIESRFGTLVRDDLRHLEPAEARRSAASAPR
jgi:3',5'-cyclic AMP phosphodiesterase CpdA